MNCISNLDLGTFYILQYHGKIIYVYTTSKHLLDISYVLNPKFVPENEVVYNKKMRPLS